MTVQPQDVADFLGRGDDREAVALAGEALPIVTAMARAYTRGRGFIGNEPNAEIAAVLVTATARMLANPGQIAYTVGGVQMGAGFQGWSLAETFVLSRYRVTAC